MPTDAGRGEAERVIETQMVEVAVTIIEESTRDMLVGRVTPGRRVRRGSAERPDGESRTDPITKVSAVNRAQTRRVGHIEASNSHGDDGVGVLVVKSQVVGSIQQLAQRCGGDAVGEARGASVLRSQIASPISREIPMSAPDATDVGIDQYPSLARTYTARFRQVTESKADPAANLV